MEANKNYTIEGTITKFVTDFNNNVRYQNFPIVAFQFVSLNKVHKGKMVWWNYLHVEVCNKYVEALNEFTGKANDDQIIHTLINWEFDKASFWDSELQNKKNLAIVQDFKHKFIPLTEPEEDKSGVEKLPADPKEKSELLNKWCDILIKKFDKKGYTMWISLPHKDVDGAVIYSSVFCLFNKIVNVDDRLIIARQIRNFIIDYLIELYGHLYKLEIKALKAGDLIDDYKFIPHCKGKLLNGEKTQIETSLEKLEEHYFQPKYLTRLEQVLRDAEKRINDSYKDNKNLDQSKLKFPKSFKKIPAITFDKSGENYFFQFIYGRLLMLAFHIIFDLTLSQSYAVLKGAKKSLSERLGELQKMFCIEGLRGDKPTTEGIVAPDKDLEKIIPFLSNSEVAFLIKLSDKYKPELKPEIIEARSI